MKWLIGVIAVFGIQGAAMAQGDAFDPQDTVQVMVLGTYHWSNPGLDMVNMEVDDVLAPRRQQEIADLAEAIAQWRPTKVAVESVEEPPELVVPEYADVDRLLGEIRNESVQLGYRIAAMLGHEAVYGIDEQSSNGEPDYFPFEAMREFAAANGQSDIVEEMLARARADSQAREGDLATQTIAETLIPHNRAQVVDAQHDLLYYSMLRIGDGESQPGAELNAYWYMRNAKMFAKLDMIAQPGDRVLLIVGSGHATWLRHFVQRMPGYELVDALPYLEAADRR